MPKKILKTPETPPLPPSGPKFSVYVAYAWTDVHGNQGIDKMNLNGINDLLTLEHIIAAEQAIIQNSDNQYQSVIIINWRSIVS